MTNNTTSKKTNKSGTATVKMNSSGQSKGARKQAKKPNKQLGGAGVAIIAAYQNVKEYQELHWAGSFEDYLAIVKLSPEVTRNAFQRVYDIIMDAGYNEYIDAKKKIIHYKFFDDPNGVSDDISGVTKGKGEDKKSGATSSKRGKDSIYGLDIPLMRLVNVFKSAAYGYGTEKRVILLHGPVGSSKSTIARLLKKGLERYSRSKEGAHYSFAWHYDEERDGEVHQESFPCPMNEEPLHLIPIAWRTKAVEDLELSNDNHAVKVKGELCPACRYVFQMLLKRYDGDFTKVMEHVTVKRLILSEKDRIGIGTFQPKDEKNQDSTELTGDINYRKIAEYGSDSDPRAFNFDGEFHISNRGIIEFIEVLKLDVAFLYDLLGASQEHSIKPKKFAQTDIDEVILGHTNEAEYKKLLNNEFMEALRDRTVKIDIPYITKLDQEVQIYEKDYSSKQITGKHVAPHTLEMAAMWAVATRLEAPKKPNLSILQKLKLYNGKTLPGYTEESVKELRKATEREGMDGISPRYIQDKISNALVSEKAEGCLNPFLLLNELESGLKGNSLVTKADDRAKYVELITAVKEEYEDLVKNEVQRAISADEDAIDKICGNYIDNIKAYTQKERVKNKYTGQFEDPDERLMRSVETKIKIAESRKDDFRREIMNYIGALAVEGKRFDFRTNERLHKALELKLFEDQKDTIKLTTLVSDVVDRDTQKKIDIVKERMIRSHGYCDICATDVLNFVASVFARGTPKEQ